MACSPSESYSRGFGMVFTLGSASYFSRQSQPALHARFHSDFAVIRPSSLTELNSLAATPSS